MTHYGPALDPPLGGSGQKVNTNVQGHEYFTPTKFGKYPSSDSVVKADYVFPYIYSTFILIFDSLQDIIEYRIENTA